MNKPGKILLWGAIIGLGLGVLMAVTGYHSPSPNIDQQTVIESNKNERLKWAVWNEEDVEDKPKADILVIPNEASGYPSYGYGYVNGRVINRTHNNYSYIQIIIGLYSKDGSKFGSCMDNMLNLESLGVWEFNAQCLEWRDDTIYKVEDVNYW